MQLTDEKREWLRQWMEVIRPMTKEWHSSEEGIEWHRKHGIECWKSKKEITIKCKECGKEAITKIYHQKFCHANCKAKYGRRIRKNKIS